VRLILPLVVLPLLLVACAQASPQPASPPEVTPAPTRLEAAVAVFVHEPGLPAELEAAIHGHAVELSRALVGAGPADVPELRRLISEQVCANLEAKAALLGPDGERFPLSTEAIRRTVVDYEAFKLSAYLSSGVFPKRYFGYFDGLWDTAEHEGRLAEVIRASTPVINAWLSEQGEPWTVNDMEIAVTWVSEGGALMLGADPLLRQNIHPIADVGLDDIFSGTAQLADLMGRLDAATGTDLGGIVDGSYDGRYARLSRYMTYEESIVGTALMWVFEKRITQRKLLRDGRPPLQDRPIDEQFVLGSLVYNSGLVHDAGRELSILAFEGAERLTGISDSNAHRRPRLPLATSDAALAALLGGAAYPDQRTSWLAVYHVLQRYGGYAALRRFTDVFDEQGAFRAK
jgi:hypothetical protein